MPRPQFMWVLMVGCGRMPEISRFFGILIRMYFDDHNPPHFHAIYAGNEAEIAWKCGGLWSSKYIRIKMPKKRLISGIRPHPTMSTHMNCGRGMYHQPSCRSTANGMRLR